LKKALCGGFFDSLTAYRCQALRVEGIGFRYPVSKEENLKQLNIQKFAVVFLQSN